VPLIRQMQGFRSYYLLDDGPDVLITISRFDNADEAFASNEPTVKIGLRRVRLGWPHEGYQAPGLL
jgi:hypothetical protein